MKTKLLITIFPLLLLYSGNLFSQNWLWARNAGGINGNDYGESVCTDQNGNIYIAGSFNSPKIIIGADTLINYSPDTADIFIAKYDANGNVLWAKSAGGQCYNYCHGIL
jgi:hypothetical protein